VSSESPDKEIDWKRKLEESGELNSDITEDILQEHGDRGRRAIEAVSEKRVKEYRDFTVVVGETEEYVIENNSCNCDDTKYNLDQNDPTDLCWHVIAATIARYVGELDHHDMWYTEVRDFL